VLSFSPTFLKRLSVLDGNNGQALLSHRIDVKAQQEGTIGRLQQQEECAKIQGVNSLLAIAEAIVKGERGAFKFRSAARTNERFDRLDEADKDCGTTTTYLQAPRQQAASNKRLQGRTPRSSTGATIKWHDDRQQRPEREIVLEGVNDVQRKVKLVLQA
jgi:hypothetical protein